MIELIDKEIKFKVPIYNGNIIIVITDNFSEYLKKVDNYYSSDDDECFGMVTTTDKHYLMLIKTSYKDDYGIVAHEAIHLANRILESRGIVISTSNDEALAYLVTYIIREYDRRRK